MTNYIQFTSAEGGIINIEVEEGEIASQRGLQKAGLREMAGKTIAVAQATFEEALERVILYNAETFIKSVRSLSALPNEAELTFGLNATGEVGNIAIAKVSGEANYMIKLTWKREDKDELPKGP